MPWIANWLETRLSHLWYTTTVASVAFALNNALATRCIKEGMTDVEANKHATMLGVCDFGLRGVECTDAGVRGGVAALTSSMSSDNTAAMYGVNQHYPDTSGTPDFKSVGSSIPAAEHSTITSHGKDKEKDADLLILDNSPTGPVSITMDSCGCKAVLPKNQWFSHSAISSRRSAALRSRRSATTLAIAASVSCVRSRSS